MTPNQDACEFPAEAVLDLVTALRRAATRWPDRAALVFDETGERLTFAALAARVDRVAATLAGIGIGSGDCVGIMLPNRAEWPLAWLGLARIGAVMVPINTGCRTVNSGFPSVNPRSRRRGMHLATRRADARADATGYTVATASISTSQSGSARLVTTANVLAGR